MRIGVSKEFYERYKAKFNGVIEGAPSSFHINQKFIYLLYLRRNNMADKTISLEKTYVASLDAYIIDDAIKSGLNQEGHITLDLTTARMVKGAFYGNILAIFKEHYHPKEVFNQLKEKLTLKFSSPDSPAYRSLQNGYNDLFAVEFSDKKAA